MPPVLERPFYTLIRLVTAPPLEMLFCRQALNRTRWALGQAVRAFYSETEQVVVDALCDSRAKQ
jgi:hypothetical protein